jgi:SOS response regulatory protein OraA/RecX
MSDEVQKKNKKPFYKRTWFFVVAGLAIGGLIASAIGGDGDVSDSPAASASQESVAQVVALVVPDLVGENASDASEELENLGFTEITLQDVSDDERLVVLSSNWSVCEMKPEPNVTLDSNKTLVLLVVKNTESCDPDDSIEPATDASPSEQSENGATATPTTTPTTTETTGERNAKNKAESYLRSSFFSRSGLIDQLLYEDFSKADAEYAVDAVDANWKVQAAGKAESYLSSSAFSRSGLVDQLLYEGYTSSEAEFGVASTNADWNVQADKKAKSYLASSSFSRQGLIDQLKYEGFSQSQAEYGVSQNGY